MFHNFSESARRIVFWARYEAARLGFQCIEAQHLLLGFILEDQGDAQSRLPQFQSIVRGFPPNRFLDSETASNLRVEFSAPGPLNDSRLTSVDMPLGNDAKSALSAAQKHAQDSTVGNLHLLWGLLANRDSPVARGLIERSVTQERVETAIRHQHAS